MRQKLNFQSKKAFSLVEFLIYFGILVFVLMMIIQIATPILKSNIITKAQTQLRQEMVFLIEKLTSEAKKAKDLMVSSDWVIFFNQPEEKIYFRFGQDSKIDSNNEILGFMTNWFVGSASFNCRNFTTTCSTYKVWYNNVSQRLEGWAWSPIIGWIHFATSFYSVNFNPTSQEFYGYAWNDAIGWIKFNCDSGGNSNNCSLKWAVKKEGDLLKGFAWNDTVGWFIFDGDVKTVFYKNGNNEYKLLSPNIEFSQVKFEKIDSSVRGYFKAKLIPPPPGKPVETESLFSLIPGILRK